MNALRTASIASRAVRTFLTLGFLALVVGLVQSKPLAAPLSFHSVTGQALALNAALRSAHILQAAPANSSGTAFPTMHGPNGRTLFNHQLMHAGAIVKSRDVSTAIPAPVAGAVQTYDLFNPSPGFQPLVGYQNSDGTLGNNPQNKPIYAPALVATNLTPVWSADESFIVFSSNRNQTGGLNTDASDGVSPRFHLWAISVLGGQAFQITTSTGPAGGGEFFPALSAGNNQFLTFTSDAQTPGVQNLYYTQFSFNAVLLGTGLNVSDNTQISSFTNVAGTGFDQVQRPTIYGNVIVFSAHSTAGQYAGHYHIYFLNITTGGFDPHNNSLPAKLTDGPADDTDPAYSNEGQFLAFASTATHIQNQDSLHSTFSSNPDTSQTLTTVPASPSANRNIFLLSGNSTATSFGTGVAPQGGTNTFTSSGLPIYAPITATGADNFGPAWSYITPNQFLNPTPGFEYLAFARGSSPSAPHDICYIQVVRSINAQGETGKSHESATTPEPAFTPIYQIAAGSGGYGSFVGDFPNSGLPFFVGGTAQVSTATAPLNQSSDPTTPAGVYSTYRDSNGSNFTYTVPNLTPGALYNIKLLFADPKDSAVGKRVFNITVSDGAGGNQYNKNLDIIQQILVGPGTLSGLVKDSVTNLPIPGANIAITDYKTGAPISTTPGPVTTTSAANSNYIANLSFSPFGDAYVVTVRAPGYGSESQVVYLPPSGGTQANFALQAVTPATQATITGEVYDANLGTNVPVPNATVTVGTLDANNRLITYGTPAAVDTNGNYSVSVPSGQPYFITATPANTNTGYQTSTVSLTPAAGSNTQNFPLGSGAAFGVVGGLVTDSTETGTPLVAGATVVIKGAGGSIVAILQTSGTSISPTAPIGDGQPLNYNAYIPTNTNAYAVAINAQNYTASSPTATVVNTPAAGGTPANEFVRANAALVNNNPTTTLNTALFVPINNLTNTTGKLVISFNAIAGSDPAFVNGIEVYTDTNAPKSSGFGGFASVDAPSAPGNFMAIGGFAGQPQVQLSWNPVPFASGYKIYRSGGPNATPTTLTSVNNPNSASFNSASGLEGNVPYLVNVPFQLNRQTGKDTYFDPDPNLTLGYEYYYQVTAILSQIITPESGTNTAIKIITENNTPDPTNVYDDVYPAWSPFKSVFSITYQSGGYNYATGVVTNGRSVTYNNPLTGHPSEVALSLPDGESIPATSTTQAFSVGTNYAGVFVSQVLNLDPPNLLRFSNNEIIHIQPGNPNDPVNGTATKYGLVNGGQSITATVRLSNRESGIDENNVYLQIKDPDSKYQDSQKLEHKVFAKDESYSNQANRPASDLSTFSSNQTIAGAPVLGGFSLDGDDLLTQVFQPGNTRYTWPTYKARTNEYPRGAHGGVWGTTTNNIIFIGKSGGGTNHNVSVDARTTPTVYRQFPGPDPNLFIPWGPEYECQFLKSSYTNYGQPGADATLTDYGTPFYLAGVDDQRPFSGDADTPRTEWLKLTRVVNQDNKGGVLYTATWNTPQSGSDFYLDVITYDKAKFPSIPANTSAFAGRSSNWRIYDNVGGFSTNAALPNSSNDVLVVSDYALGQKFAGTTFAGQNGNVNLVPKLYGAESYITDVDINILPDTNFAGWPLRLDSTGVDYGPYLQLYAGLRTLNGLGVGSYSDPVTESYGAANPQDGVPADTSQQYAIWRILSRGPVPQNLLNAYTPKPVAQPPVTDLQGPTAYQNVPGATVLNANRCVVWLSPYTGDLFTDPGALDDPGSFSIPGQPDRQSTQTILRNFVQSGGRLFITGQDIGSALTLNGTVANAAGGFLSDVLNATLVSSNGGSNHLVGTNGINNRITGDPGYDSLVAGTAPGVYWTLGGAPIVPPTEHIGPTFAGFTLSFLNFPYLDNLVLGSEDQSDGSLDQRIDALNLNSGANLLGQIDTIAPVNNAVTAMTYGANGPAALVYHDDPYNPAGKGTLPNGGTGSRVVYAAFGMEGISSDAYSPLAANSGDPYFVPPVIPRNPRPEMLHNIICYLRTGFVSGNVTQTAGSGLGAGQGVVGATVYLIPVSGNAPPTRAVFSATTINGGQFTIAGVEPGVYTLAAYKTGYSHGASNSGVVYDVEGDVNVNAGTALTIGPLQPGKIAGTVSDPKGNPIADATVIFKSKDQTISVSGLTFGGQNAATATNPIGTYSVPSVPVTEYDTATANGPNNPNGKPEYISSPAPLPPFSTAAAPFVTIITVQTNQITQPVNFVLTPILATISGRIYDKTAPPVGGDNATGGALVSGATVTATDSTGAVVATTSAAADGTYTLTGLPSGPGSATAAYTITATKAGYSTTGNTTQPLTVYLGDMLTSTADDIGLTPIAPGVLTGTVTDSKTGAPVPGALVTFTSADKTVTYPNVAADSNGVYTIPNVPPGSYSGTATGPNNPHGLPTATAGPAQTVTVTSAPPNTTVNFTVTTIPPSIAGTVTDSSTKKPLQNVVITITDSSGNVIPTTPALVQTAADGTYSTGALPTGTYTLTASLAGYVTQIIGPYTFYNGDVITGNNIALVQAAPGSLSGRVTDKTTGLPVPGAAVTFVSTDGTVTLPATTTDANGNYNIPSPTALTNPAGNYIGTATGPVNANGKPEFQVSAPLNTTINPGAATTGANFALIENPASISGTVTDGQIATAPGVAGVAVTLTDTNGNVIAKTTTNATGSYSFNPVAAGQSPTTYTLTASLPSGYLDSTQTVTISLGDTLTLPITLNEKGIIYGLATDNSALLASPAALASVTITITDTATGGTVTTTPTPLTTANATTAGPDGKPANYQATFIVTPGHTYTVVASKPNYDLVKSVTITPTKGTPVRADLQLTSSTGLLGGLVSDATTGAPVGGATITVKNAAGTAVATITSSGSITTAPDTINANYQGQVTEGTYSVTLTKGDRSSVTQSGVVIVGGKFNRLNFTSKYSLPALFTFPAGLQFVSTPYDYSALGFDGVFGTLNTAATGTTPNGNRSHVAVWDPTVAAYALDPTAPADTLRLGIGYWVYLRAATPVTQQGASPTTPYVQVSLHPSWNQIGVPNPTTDGNGNFQTVAVGSLKFDNGQGSMISFAQAASSQYHLVSPTLYSFDGTSYQPVTSTGVLSPWKAYWIKVYANATLEFPTQLAPKPTQLAPK